MIIFPMWLRNLASYRVGRIFEKIFKIIQYIPVLWMDDDWDGSFLLSLMRYKLKRMKKCLKKGQSTEERLDEQQKQISRALELLDEIINDWFTEKEWDEFWKKYGKPDFSKNTKISDEESADIKRLGKLEVERSKKTYGEFFGILMDHIQEWWD